MLRYEAGQASQAHWHPTGSLPVSPDADDYEVQLRLTELIDEASVSDDRSWNFGLKPIHTSCDTCDHAVQDSLVVQINPKRKDSFFLPSNTF